MTPAATLLIIDDEPQIRKFLRICLATQGYRILEAATGTEGLSQAALEQPDLVILDLGLPDMDGASEAQKVQALDNGANDYVTKPFGIQEFLARVRALLRQGANTDTGEASVSVGPLRIDLAARRVTLEGVAVELTRKEYAVLLQLARHPGRLVTQHQLLADIWGPTHVEKSHYVRIVIGHLRRKLGDDPALPRFIVTAPGIGYRLLE
jgi:two-component system KDP operon response regulator KdpE